MAKAEGGEPRLMRLRKLLLSRYGKFTDREIDFGERPENAPDLHIVFGPNEAGKTTLLSGWLDFLYGFSTQKRRGEDRASPYAFLHPLATLEVGAALEAGEERRFFLRNKAGLFDDRGQPLPDRELGRFLDGLERDAWRSMFSLDEDSLEQGGEDILASRGDLGRLLFSASAGLADFSGVLQELEDKAGQFYRPYARGKSTALGAMKSELEALAKEKTDSDVMAADYGKLTAALGAHQGELQKIRAEKQELEDRLGRMNRARAALSHLDRLARLERKIAPDLPDAPPGWVELSRSLAQQEHEAAGSLRMLQDHRARLERELLEISVDPEALRQKAGIEAAEILHARYLTAAKDLPDRRIALADFDREIRNLLVLLGREKETRPEKLLIDPALIPELRAALSNWRVVMTKIETAHKEADGARSKIHALPHSTTTGDRPDYAPLEGALAMLAADLSEDRKNAAEERIRALQPSLDAAFARLAPWIGDAESLSRMAPPDRAQLSDWKRILADLAVKIGYARKNVEQHERDILRLGVENQALIAENPAMGEDSGRTRGDRDSAWLVHQQRLDQDSAEKFHQLLQKDDLLTSIRLSQADALARQNQILRQTLLLQAEAQQAKRDEQSLTAERDALSALVQKTMRALDPSLPESWSLDSFAQWLEDREAALLLYRDQSAEEARVWRAEQERQALAQKLRKALEAAQSPCSSADDFETLRARAHEAARQKALREKQEERLGAAQEELRLREEALDAARKNLDLWKKRWSELCALCWFGGDETAPEEASRLLEHVEKLAALLERRDDLALRILNMEQDQDAFERRALEIAEKLGVREENPLTSWHLAKESAKEAASRKKSRDDKQAELEEAKIRLADLQASQKESGARKAEMAAHFSLDDFSGVPEKLAALEENRRLRQEAEEAKEAICQTLGVAQFEEAHAALDGFDRERSLEERGRLANRLADLERMQEEVMDALSSVRAKMAALDGDDKIARINERRRAIVETIEDEAARYLRLKAGTTAISMALSIFRDRHRSQMLEEASLFFERISRGFYQGLRAQPDKNGEKLIAIAENGAAKQADALSRGTRFQLYLALRIAGYYEYGRRGSLPPFIADDIMESFDDDRSLEVFGLFASMARQGQIIYLTHHRHLCELAQKACPAVKIHNL